MKKISVPILCALFLGFFYSCKKDTSNQTTNPPETDSFSVTVNNGYGSGKYKVGDTVHIFSKAYPDNQMFGKWSGDISQLNSPDEWHTWFIMPNKNVTVTGSIQNAPGFTLKYEQIKGRDRLKPVYYYFPQNVKGVVYLLHGTGGSAANLVATYEWQEMIKDLVNDHFGIIITEAEESTTQNDANGDGKIRWALIPNDTITNVDYANIRIITDTFYNRGLINRSLPRYSIGMSDGGFFSAALSNIYQFKAGVQYCSQGPSNIMSVTNVPIQFCMARFDSNPSIGATGNADALSYSKSLNARGVCSKYFINERSPIYPERFARTGVIPINISISIFDELKSNGLLDNKNYFIGYSDALTAAIQKKPSNFPVLKNFSPQQLQPILAQISIAVADHHIYSDYDRATVKFLDNQCQ